MIRSYQRNLLWRRKQTINYVRKFSGKGRLEWALECLPIGTLFLFYMILPFKKTPNCIIWQFKNILKFEIFKNHHLSFHIHFLPIGPVCVLSHICDPMNYIAFQAPLSMESSTEGYWSGLSFTTPGDLPNPGVKPMSFSISCIGRQILYHCATREAPNRPYDSTKQ